MSKEFLAPLPGVFYRKPAPDKPPFKSDGDIIAVGDVVGLIEVMKSFVEVQADISGKILRFIVGDEEPIMAGQRQIGTLGSTSGGHGLALLRIDRLADADLDRAAAGADLLGVAQVDLFAATRQILRLAPATVALPPRHGRHFRGRRLDRRRDCGFGQVHPVEEGRAPHAAGMSVHRDVDHLQADIGVDLAFRLAAIFVDCHLQLGAAFRRDRQAFLRGVQLLRKSVEGVLERGLRVLG